MRGSASQDPQGSQGDWRWQIRHAVKTVRELDRVLQLSREERAGAETAEHAGFPFLLTPYLLGLCSKEEPGGPLRRQFIPHAHEQRSTPGDLADPLGEVAHQVAPELIRRYPDRALLLTTDQCAAYCRFCTRSRLVGSGEGPRSLQRLGPALTYLRAHTEIRDVILSGGDVLVQSTARITAVVAAVRSIPHVETIRIATRVPSLLPQRITPKLLESLRPYHPLFVMSHFNHPDELTALARHACEALANGGFPVLNQAVLLRGVNDDAETLARLFRGLVRVRIRPYYLLQADPVKGTGHLRTPLATGVRLMGELQGKLSGIALPKLIVDTPGGQGKVPIQPDYVVGQGGGLTRLRTPGGAEVDYLDP